MANDPTTAGSATIYDVATQAEVSISTVSLTINNPGRVAESTRLRVLAAADALGFIPKADAVSRARRSLGRVGVIAPFSSYPSYWRRLNGFIGAIGAVDVTIFDHTSASVMASPTLDSLPLSRRLDGLVVMGLPLDETTARRLSDHGLPTVLVDSQSPGFDAVVTNEASGAALVAEHLRARGDVVIGYLQERDVANHLELQGHRRFNGFADAMARDGAPAPTITLHTVEHSIAAARSGALELLAGSPTPTALVAHDDTLAAGAIQAVRQLGLRPGADIAIVGYDGSELAEALDLTTVAQPFEESGLMAARVMSAYLGGKAAPVHVSTLGLELVVRGSSLRGS